MRAPAQELQCRGGAAVVRTSMRVGNWIIECATAAELLARVGGDGRPRG